MKHLVLAAVLVSLLSGPAGGAELPPIAKVGETVTIKFTAARLCPTIDHPDYPVCPTIPIGVTLEVKRIHVQQVYFGKGTRPRSWDVVWYLVRYKKKWGWIAEYSTDRQPDGKVRNKKTWRRK